MAIDLDEVRRLILIALFSDDELMEALVFKGGNALALIHKVGSRASLDCPSSKYLRLVSVFNKRDSSSSLVSI